MKILNRQIALFVYKLVAICILLIMLALFISCTIEKDEDIETIEKPCTGETVLYFGFSMFLGAFINVKGLVKLGVI
jgi:hypothetical protein